jgi:hypothetical protein
VPALTFAVMLVAAIITAAATVVLALLAYAQIKANGKQTAEAIEIARESREAALAIARESREAAERQWQPRVFAHAWGAPRKGSGDDVAPNEKAVGYYLGNEGTGPAFNIEHGVQVGKKRFPWIGQYRTMRAGEQIPPMLDSIGKPIQLVPLYVGVPLDEWTDDGDVVYWTRFENLLGERFEVRNYPDPNRSAEFQRLARPDPPVHGTGPLTGPGNHGRVPEQVQN